MKKRPRSCLRREGKCKKLLLLEPSKILVKCNSDTFQIKRLQTSRFSDQLDHQKLGVIQSIKVNDFGRTCYFMLYVWRRARYFSGRF